MMIKPNKLDVSLLACSVIFFASIAVSDAASFTIRGYASVCFDGGEYLTLGNGSSRPGSATCSGGGVARDFDIELIDEATYGVGFVVTTPGKTFNSVQFSAVNASPCYDYFSVSNSSPVSGPFGYAGQGLNAVSYTLSFSVKPKRVLFTWDAPKINGRYTLPADGASTTMASKTEASITGLSWEIVGDSLGASINENTGELRAGVRPGTVRVRASSTGPCYEELIDLDCPQTCNNCGNSFASPSGAVGSIDFRMNVGWSKAGNTAGFLHILEESPGPHLATPSALRYPFIKAGTERILTNGVLRQLLTPEGLADVVTITSNKYEVRFFNRSNVYPMTLNGLLYRTSNSPLATYTVESPGGDTNKLKVTHNQNGSESIWEYESITNGWWELTSGGGLRKERQITEWAETNTLRILTTTIREGDGPVVFHKVQKYRTNSVWQGERMITEIMGTAANAITNTYEYTTNGYLQLVVRGDGSWEYYQYDSSNRPTNVFSAFKNVGVTTSKSLCRVLELDYSTNVISGAGDTGYLETAQPRKTTEKIEGNVVAVNYFVALPGEHRDIRCVNPEALWNDPANLVTTNRFYTNGLYRNELRSAHRPNGTVDIMEYAPQILTNLLFTNIMMKGHADSFGTNIDKGTRVVSVTDSNGVLLEKRGFDAGSDPNVLLFMEAHAYDGNRRLTNTTFLDGTSLSQSYDCCALSSRVDRDGTITSYSYDALKRLAVTTRNGISLINTYDAHGNLLKIERQGTNGTTMTLSETTYDDAGRVTTTKDALSNTIVFTNYMDSNTQVVRRITYPNTGTRIETYYRDGSLKTIDGTGVRGVSYDYGPVGDGTQYTFESRLSGGSETDEWVWRISDMVGRPTDEWFSDGAVVQRTHSVAASAERDPDGVVRLFFYNSLGELEDTVLDMNRDFDRDYGEADRITRTVSDVVTNGTYGTNVRRTRSYVWSTEGSAVSNLLSTVETSVNGLSTWNTFSNAGVAVVSSVRTAYTNGHRYVTNTAFDGTYIVQDFLQGRLLSETRKDTNGNQITAITYTYDPHGRVLTAVDARNGPTTFAYDNNDRQTSVTVSNQTTLTHYNSMGWVTNVVPPDSSLSGSIRTEYHLTGEVATNWGARTYPVAYTYDYAGRLKTMTTWTNFAARQGAATTTWNYDVFRGFLTNKTYADQSVVKYGYSEAGRLKSRTWARNVTCTYVTNGAGEIAITYYGDSTPGVTNIYDRRGRVTQVNHGTNTSTVLYDDLGQVVSETFNGLTVSNVYNGRLQRDTMQFHIGSSPQITNTFAHDAAARLQAVSDGTFSATYAYHPNSALISGLTFKQGSTERLTTYKDWDALNRLTSVYSSNSVIGPSGRYMIFNYNDANQRYSIARNDVIQTYQYDSLGQVIAAGRAWNTPTVYLQGQQFYTGYDDIGNRTYAARGGNEWFTGFRFENYIANNLNQYTQRTVPGKVDVFGDATNTAIVTVNNEATYRQSNYFRKELTVTNIAEALWFGVTNIAVVNVGTNYDIVTNITGNAFVPQTPEIFSYDADGNLTSDGRWMLTWDAENRLIRMESHSNAPAGSKLLLEFGYDYRARRVSKIVHAWTGSNYLAQLTNRFAYDGWNLIAVLNHQSSILQSFMWGADLSGSMRRLGGVGSLLMLRDVTHGTHFVHCDANGNIAALVNGVDGTISAEYEYGPFGEPMRSESPVAKVNPVRFASKYSDLETGWVVNGHRYYDPIRGQSASREPLGERASAHAYIHPRNDPVNRIDILGLVDADLWYDRLANWAREKTVRQQGISEDLLASGTVFWWEAGLTDTFDELVTGVLTFPSMIGHLGDATGETGYIGNEPLFQPIASLGTGAGAFSVDPFSWENAAGLAQDISVVSGIGAAGFKPIAFANRPLFKKRPPASRTPCPQVVSRRTPLTPAERATLERLRQRGYDVRESPSLSEEYLDDIGRSYDQLGDPRASQFWNEAAFLKSIDWHLLKANDFTVIDLTDFSTTQINAVRNHINKLPDHQRQKIIKVGF